MCASKSPWLSVLLAAAVLIAVMQVAPAFAADKKVDPNKGEVRRLQQAQRQLTREKTLLAEQKTAVEGELDETRKKADGEMRRAAALTRELAAQRSAREAAEARLAQVEAELHKTLASQRLAEAESQRLRNVLSAEQQQHRACVESGKALREAGGEVLELYEQKSCLDSALQHEPFTGLKRVEVENAVEDLRNRLDSQPSGS